MRRKSDVDWIEDENGCWIWQLGLYTPGYGIAWDSVAKNNRGAHILAWERENGPVPDGLHVRHTCDVRACVRPSHLVIGTRSDNMQDMYERGRWNSGVKTGEQNSNAKLTDAQVEEIRALWQAGGVSKTALARTYGVSDVWIGRLVKGLAR